MHRTTHKQRLLDIWHRELSQTWTWCKQNISQARNERNTSRVNMQTAEREMCGILECSLAKEQHFFESRNIWNISHGQNAINNLASGDGSVLCSDVSLITQINLWLKCRHPWHSAHCSSMMDCCALWKVKVFKTKRLPRERLQRLIKTETLNSSSPQTHSFHFYSARGSRQCYL